MYKYTVFTFPIKSGERSSGLIPAIPLTTIIKYTQLQYLLQWKGDQQVISVQHTSHYLYSTEKVHNVLYYRGFLELGTGTCKASASYMLRQGDRDHIRDMIFPSQYRSDSFSGCYNLCLEKGSDQLFVTLYTLSIFSSVHKLLIRTILGANCISAL